jgi:glucokinase
VTRTIYALDIGGTAIKLGLVSADGRLLLKDRIAFDPELGFDVLADRLAASLSALAAEIAPSPIAIGVATPGFSDPDSGVVVDGAGNVPVLRERSLRRALSERLGLPSVVANDGVAAAIGEARFGAGRSLSRFALFTFGTGVGGAVVIDGRPLVGARGEPPELGAIAVGDVAREGPAASLEQRACAAAFVAAYREAGGTSAAVANGQVDALFECLATGDAAAATAVDQVARHIAQAAGILINAIGLEACVIGGGIAEAGSALTAPILRHLPDFTWPFLMRSATIHAAALGNDAGLLGVAALANEQIDVRDDADALTAPASGATRG